MKIRDEFFNELARFKSLLKLAQQAGGLTAEIKKALKDLTDDAAKTKKVKKSLKMNTINDSVQNKEIA